MVELETTREDHPAVVDFDTHMLQLAIAMALDGFADVAFDVERGCHATNPDAVCDAGHATHVDDIFSTM